MTRILASVLLALTLAGCGVTTGSLAEIPDELLHCQGAPTWRRGGTQSDVANHIVDWRAAHGDCSGKLGEIRTMARPGS